MKTITLANLILDPSGIPDNNTNVLYRTGGTCAWKQDDSSTDAHRGALEFSGEVDLMTYLNLLPLAKWRQYTTIDNVFVQLDLKGEAELQIRRAYTDKRSKIVSIQGVDLSNARASSSWQNEEDWHNKTLAE